MTIYSKAPAGWKDSQAKIAELLSEIGHECEIEKDIQTARETVDGAYQLEEFSNIVRSI